MRSRTIPRRLGIALAAAAITLVGAAGARASVNPTQCAHPKGPFTTSGTHIMGYVLNHQHAPVRLYGITTFGLTEPDWDTSSDQAADEAQMDAMADDWCANAVRIQAAPAYLFEHSATLRATYIQAIRGEIQHAFADNLVVILTAQTENGHSGAQGATLPDQRTAYYWKTLGHAFAGYNNLIFDIFNEPRNLTDGSDQMWSSWHSAMQTLVTRIRHDGIHRQLWVQGPDYGDTLSRVTDPQDAISDPDHNLVYDIHHPLGPAKQTHTAAEWNPDFGNAAGQVPVVVGEWTNYSPPKAGAPECWNDAPTAVPNFLNYTYTHSDGLIGWTLAPGVLVNGPSLTAPTGFGTGWSCTSYVDQGAGTDLMDFFAEANARSSY